MFEALSEDEMAARAARYGDRERLSHLARSLAGAQAAAEYLLGFAGGTGGDLERYQALVDRIGSVGGHRGSARVVAAHVVHGDVEEAEVEYWLGYALR